MPNQPPNPRIFLSAGEASGDHYGAQLIASLRQSLPQADFLGLGGAEMEAAGQRRIVHAEDVAHMGITEVLRHALFIFRQYRKLVAAIKRERPQIAVLIDFPDVNFRLAKHLKRAGIPVVWLVSPQLWAWKKSRLRWVQQRVSKMLAIFPFEAPFYRAHKVDATFIGHPLTTLAAPSTTRDEYAKQYNLDPAKHWIALLPGSRTKELRLNLPTMLEAASQLGSDYDYILPVASTINRADISAPTNITLVPDARAALFHARASVVASGTATIQAALIGNPFLVVYKVSALTYQLAKRLISYPPEIPAQPDASGNLPIAMPNLIAGRRIVPELIQHDFTAANVATALKPLLADTPARAQQLHDLAQLRAQLSSPTPTTPIQTAAQSVLDLLG